MRTPVHVLGGFLGTGKTTTLLELLRQGRERVAVVVNDFGEARIDAERVGAGYALRSIEGGCVCCTAPAGLPAAVAALLDEERPDRVVIEPSGLARPQDVLDMLSRGPLAERLELRGLVVLVDPERLREAEGEEARLLEEQLQGADVLVANRCDLASPEALELFRERASTLWPAPALVLETSHGRLSPEAWAAGRGQGPGSAGRVAHDHTHLHEHGSEHGSEHAHGDAAHPAPPAAPGAPARAPAAPSTAGFVAVSWQAPRERRFSWDALGALLRGSPGLVRAKGMFRTDIGWVRMDFAGGRLSSAPTAYRRDNRADLIALAGTELGALIEALEGCDTALSGGGEAAGPGVELLSAAGDSVWLGRERLAALPGQVGDVGTFVPGRAGEGVWLREVLALCGAAPDARYVVAATDGMVSPPARLDGVGEALLVHGLGGAELPASQGGPFRLLTPPGEGRSNCANVKGVAQIRILPSD